MLPVWQPTGTRLERYDRVLLRRAQTLMAQGHGPALRVDDVQTLEYDLALYDLQTACRTELHQSRQTVAWWAALLCDDPLGVADVLPRCVRLLRASNAWQRLWRSAKVADCWALAKCTLNTEYALAAESALWSAFRRVAVEVQGAHADDVPDLVTMFDAAARCGRNLGQGMRAAVGAYESRRRQRRQEACDAALPWLRLPALTDLVAAYVVESHDQGLIAAAERCALTLDAAPTPTSTPDSVSEAWPAPLREFVDNVARHGAPLESLWHRVRQQFSSPVVAALVEDGGGHGDVWSVDDSAATQDTLVCAWAALLRAVDAGEQMISQHYHHHLLRGDPAAALAFREQCRPCLDRVWGLRSCARVRAVCVLLATCGPSLL